MLHTMSLHNAPFQMIKSGEKTIELRLNDEKRKKIKVGDIIEFSRTDDSSQTLIVQVIDLHVFPSFAELYKELPLLKCGYTEKNIDTASPDDMDAYYSKEDQQKYGVVGIEMKRQECEGIISLYTPSLEDLWFRQQMMANPETMSYNHAWGGTIPFPKEEWHDWYDFWIVNHENKRYYRYLKDNTDLFIGEIAYHYDSDQNIYIADIIVYAPYRGKGYGGIGLDLLCSAAKQNGVEILYDDLAIDNPAITMFLKHGFIEEYRTDEIIMLSKEL